MKHVVVAFAALGVLGGIVWFITTADPSAVFLIFLALVTLALGELINDLRDWRREWQAGRKEGDKPR